MAKAKKITPLKDHHSERSEQYVKELRENATPAELHFKQMLTECDIEFVFQRAVKAPGCFWIIDFYIPITKTCVEIDGGYHRGKKQSGKDARRDAWMRERGCRTLRLTNEEVLKMTSTDLILKRWFVPPVNEVHQIKTQPKQLKKKWKVLKREERKTKFFKKRYITKIKPTKPVEDQKTIEQRKLSDMEKFLMYKMQLK